VVLARIATAGVLLALVPVPSWGSEILFSTFGQPGDTYQEFLQIPIGGNNGQEIAVDFVAGFGGTLDSIRVAVSWSRGPTDFFSVYLAADNSGEPGVALETFSPLVFPDDPVILTLDSLTNPDLSAGSRYWVVMTAADLSVAFGLWHVNNVGETGSGYRSASDTGGEWAYFASSIAPAVEVNVTAATTNVPEPSTTALAVFGLVGLVMSRRRARR
jgi:hypothetical protein